MSIQKSVIFLFKDIGFYGGLRALSIITTFFAIPVLTNLYGVQGYGVLETMEAATNLFAIFFIFGMDSAIARFYYDDDTLTFRKEVISIGFLLQVVFILSVLPILLYFGKSITTYYFSESTPDWYFFVVFSNASFTAFNLFAANVFKWSMERKKYAISYLSYFSLQLIILVLVHSRKWNLDTYFKLLLLAGFLEMCLNLLLLRNWLIVPSKSKLPIQMLKFSIPIGLVCIGGAFIPVLDRKLIASFLGLTTLGSYSLGFKLASVLVYLNTFFHLAWGPFYMSLFKKGTAVVSFNFILKGFAFLILILIFIFYFSFSKILPNIFPDYPPADILALILLLLFGTFFQGISSIAGIGIGLAKKTHLTLLIQLISFGAGLILAFALIPKFGIIGAGLTYLITNAIKSGVEIYISFLVFPSIRFNLAQPLALVAAGILVLQLLHQFSLYSSPMFFVLFSIVFFSICAFFLFSRTERLKAAIALRSALNKINI